MPDSLAPRFKRDIHDLAVRLRERQARGVGCTILVGAGCSVTGGVLLAQGIVEHIRDRDKPTYDLAVLRATRIYNFVWWFAGKDMDATSRRDKDSEIYHLFGELDNSWIKSVLPEAKKMFPATYERAGKPPKNGPRISDRFRVDYSSDSLDDTTRKKEPSDRPSNRLFLLRLLDLLSTEELTVFISFLSEVQDSASGDPSRFPRLLADKLIDAANQTTNPAPPQWTPSAEELYEPCMSSLMPNERQRLFEGLTQNEVVNAAHLGIATLMRERFVRRIVTVNFDSLIPKACALEDQFPAIYDLTVAPQTSTYADRNTQAVYYLHGQLSGYQLKNTATETSRQADAIEALFDFGRTPDLWIVVGYSGTCDYIFTRYLANASSFQERLYWVAYKEDEPASTVREKLFGEDKGAYVIHRDGAAAYGADEFFRELMNALQISPSCLTDPLKHIDRQLGKLKNWSTPDDAEDMVRQAQEIVSTARVNLKPSPVSRDRNTSELEVSHLPVEPSEARDIGPHAVVSAPEESSSIPDTQDLETIQRVLDDRGIALLRDWDGIRDDVKRRGLLNDAEHCFGVLEQLREGRGSYGLARIAIRKNQVDSCQRHLERARSTGFLPSRDIRSEDSHLEKYQGQPWLEEIFERARMES